MSDKTTPHVSPMEGRGFYNRHATVQAGGGALALPLLEEAARLVNVGSGDRPLVVADYGCAQGKNSLVPVRTAIGILRARTSPQQTVFVYHIDLPANDFGTLFEELESGVDSYVRIDPNAFSSAIGRSFYRSVLPPNHVDLAWSSYAAQWLDQVPRRIPNHFYIPCSSGDVRAAFDSQAASDWEKFLSLRGVELRPGGRLVVALPALAEDGSTPFAMMTDHANAVVAELVPAGIITAEEREQMILPAYARRKSDLLAPFVRDGEFQGLVVEHCSISVVPDTAWTTTSSIEMSRHLRANASSSFGQPLCPHWRWLLRKPGVPRSVRHLLFGWSPAYTSA